MIKYIKVILLTVFISVSSPVTSIYTKSSFIIPLKVSEVKTTVKEEVKVIEDETTYIATWYNLHGNRTASGERFHKDSLTAAYNFAKLGTYLKVTNINNEESVIVKVTDRMGNKSPNRIDLSISAFDSIANLSSGKAKVLIEVVK
jgi:rare lipoprotein A